MDVRKSGQLKLKFKYALVKELFLSKFEFVCIVANKSNESRLSGDRHRILGRGYLACYDVII